MTDVTDMHTEAAGGADRAEAFRDNVAEMPLRSGTVARERSLARLGAALLVGTGDRHHRLPALARHHQPAPAAGRHRRRPHRGDDSLAAWPCSCGSPSAASSRLARRAGLTQSIPREAVGRRRPSDGDRPCAGPQGADVETPPAESCARGARASSACFSALAGVLGKLEQRLLELGDGRAELLGAGARASRSKS